MLPSRGCSARSPASPSHSAGVAARAHLFTQALRFERQMAAKIDLVRLRDGRFPTTRVRPL